MHNLNTTLELAERYEALGGTVKVRQEGDAVHARLEMDAGALFPVAGNYNENNVLQHVSGGVICTVPSVPEAVREVNQGSDL